MLRIKQYIKEIFSLASKPEMRILPGQLSFFFLLSIIPLLALLGNIATFFSLPVEQVINLFSNQISEDIIQLLYPIIITTKGVNLFIFYLTAFILASNATNAMIITANSIYKIKGRGFFRNWIKAIFMMVGLLSLIIFIILVPILGDAIVSFVADLVKSTNLKREIVDIYRLIKYPLTIIYMFLNIKFLYVMSPDMRIKSKSTNKGALFTTILWIIVTEIYVYYITYFVKYNLFYGSLANILTVFIWLYFMSYIFIVGMAINSRSYLRKIENED